MSRNEAIANWWCEVISNPQFDNGTEDQGGTPMAMILMSLNAALNKASDENIELFRKNMIEYLDENPNIRSLDVDYVPDGRLSEIAKKSGISLSLFPCKTCMCISNDKVIAKIGYAGNIEGWHTVWNTSME